MKKGFVASSSCSGRPRWTQRLREIEASRNWVEGAHGVQGRSILLGPGAETSGLLVMVDKSLYHSEPRFTHLYNRCDNEPLTAARCGRGCEARGGRPGTREELEGQRCPASSPGSSVQMAGEWDAGGIPGAALAPGRSKQVAPGARASLPWTPSRFRYLGHHLRPPGAPQTLAHRGQDKALL